MVYVIAEIGQAHDGSLGIAHSYIDALINSGINAIKFQTHVAKAESSDKEPFRVQFSYQDQTRYDYWQRMEFTKEQWAGLKDHCHNLGFDFISSPFSNYAVDLLNDVGVDKFKVGSGEVNNSLLIEKIIQTGKPVILSSGLSSYQDLDKRVSQLEKARSKYSILQCTTSYPTTPEQWGLNIISKLKNRYNVPIGFSDHSGDIYACLAAVTLGAQLVEFHVTFDQRMFGPDSSSSITIDKVKGLVKGIRMIEIANSHPIEKSFSVDESLRRIFGKSLSINKDLKKGHILQFEDLESKKPGDIGLSSDSFKSVLGAKLNKDKCAYDFLYKEDIDIG